MIKAMVTSLFQRPSRWLAFAFLLGAFLALPGLGRAEDIQLDDSGAQPTPTAVPPKAAVPTPTATPVPKPKHIHHQPTPTLTPEADQGDEEDQSLTAIDRLAKAIQGKTVLVLTGDFLLTHPYQGLVPGYADNGFGADLRMELEFPFWVSFGVDYDFNYLLNHKVVIGTLDLVGRIIPFQTSQSGAISPYLIGGLGVNSLTQINDPIYPGNFHGFAGAGARINIDSHVGVDLNAVYNYYSPQLLPMSSVSVRGGLSYAFGI